MSEIFSMKCVRIPSSFSRPNRCDEILLFRTPLPAMTSCFVPSNAVASFLNSWTMYSGESVSHKIFALPS